MTTKDPICVINDVSERICDLEVIKKFMELHINQPVDLGAWCANYKIIGGSELKKKVFDKFVKKTTQIRPNNYWRKRRHFTFSGLGTGKFWQQNSAAWVFTSSPGCHKR